MSDIRCKLRKCQGKRGCVCVKSPTKQVYLGVLETSGENDATAVSPTVLSTPRGSHTRINAALRTSPVRSPPPSTNNKVPPTSTQHRLPKEGNKNRQSIGEGTVQPANNVQQESTNTARPIDLPSPTPTTNGGDETAAQPTVPENVSEVQPEIPKAVKDNKPQTGSVTLKYNHYTHQVDVLCPPGSITIADVDELFSLSYGYKGDYVIHLRGPGEDGGLLTQTDDVITGLEIGHTYWCQVDEDPEEAKKEKTVYKASGNDTTVRAGGDAVDGEDAASCSCVEGNPCAVAYNCKNWANRFDVAKANGWKGF
eukprot:m.86257 g.86257  ORF g.86257 m.86257 type:complete len:310 (-) comp25949_c0_seq1:16-945(-)